MTSGFWQPYSPRAALVRRLIPDWKFDLRIDGGLRLTASIKRHLYLFRRTTLLHEVGIARRLTGYVPEDAVIYDLGANIGLYSLVFAANRRRRVVAFEPFDQALVYLRHNIRENGFDNIEVHAVVVTDRTGTCRFTYDPVTLYTSHISAVDEQGVNLACIDLDSYVRDSGLPPPALVKIDVEGADLGVLAGMTRLLREHRPIVFLEGGIRDARGRIEAVPRLRDMGYAIWNLDRTRQLSDTAPDYWILAVRQPG
jgi:FkbM family methyltransferase